MSTQTIVTTWQMRVWQAGMIGIWLTLCLLLAAFAVDVVSGLFDYFDLLVGVLTGVLAVMIAYGLFLLIRVARNWSARGRLELDCARRTPAPDAR